MSQERPAEPASADVVDATGTTEGEDTEGHSMLTYELGLNVARERQRQAERAARDAGRTGSRERRGIIDRLRRR